MCASTICPLAPGVYAFVPNALIPNRRRTGRQTKPSGISIASSSSMWARFIRETPGNAGRRAASRGRCPRGSTAWMSPSASSSFARRRWVNASSLFPASASKQPALYVDRPVVGLLRDQLLHDLLPLLEASRLPVRVRESERVPTAGLERLADAAADDEDDRAVLGCDRGAMHLRRHEDERSRGRVGGLVADRERRASAHDDVQLLVAAVLLVRRHQLPARVRLPCVDARGPEAEEVPDRDEGGALAMWSGLRLVEREDLVALAHAVASRRASSTTGSIASPPSTRSSRFSTPAQAASES